MQKFEPCSGRPRHLSSIAVVGRTEGYQGPLALESAIC
jgi:hypothetical protein